MDFLAPLSGRSVRQRHGRHSRGGKGHHHRHHKGKHLKAPEEENRPGEIETEMLLLYVITD